MREAAKTASNITVPLDVREIGLAKAHLDPDRWARGP
jgi:hypothetical protein